MDLISGVRLVKHILIMVAGCDWHVPCLNDGARFNAKYIFTNQPFEFVDSHSVLRGFPPTAKNIKYNLSGPNVPMLDPPEQESWDWVLS